MATDPENPVKCDLPGYLSPDFGESYRPFGDIIRLPKSGLQFLKRSITGNLFDLIGLYPYSMSANWPGLKEDAGFLRATGAVSVTFVADPFCTGEIREIVSDWTMCRDFKSHFVVNLRKDWRTDRPKETRRVTRRALELQSVSLAEHPKMFTTDLWSLYQNTIVRFDIEGVQRFSEEVIRRKLGVKGAILHVAQDKIGITGAQLDFHQGATANYHLVFLSSRAHEVNTSYALLFNSLAELEKRGCSLMNLGGGAGLNDDLAGGLAQFKRRWSNEKRMTLVCGNVLNRSTYTNLCAEVLGPKNDFFPTYRMPGGPFEWSARELAW